MTDYPTRADSYATAIHAVRLMMAGSREEFTNGSDTLAAMDEGEARNVLSLMARELVQAVAALTDREPSDVLDHMALRNIENAEELTDDE